MKPLRFRGNLPSARACWLLGALVSSLAFACAAVAQTAAPPAAPKAAAATKAADAKAKPAAKASATQFKRVIEPRAMELLKAASEALAAAKTMSFTAVASYEYPSKLGPPIVYTTRYDVTMQRPDKLRVLMPGDGPASEFYYDGKAMIAYAPAENLAAFADAPSTIDEMLDLAFRSASIYFPFEDALVRDPYAALTRGAELAFYVGPSSVIGNVKTDMVVWASPQVFLQMWMGAEDRLPRRIRAIFRNDPLALRHQVDFSDWRLDGAVAPGTFASEKVAGAGRMAFASPAPPPKGAAPITRPKAGDKPAAKPKTNG